MKRLFLSTLAALGVAAQAADPVVAFPQPTREDFARTTPYSLVGQLLFKSGRGQFSGSGTVIRPSSVITAGHNLYDPVHGRSTNLLFRRSQYGDTNLGETVPNRILILGGYRDAAGSFGTESRRAFALDTGALRFAAPVADGASAGWSTDRSLLTGTSYNIALGYGGEFHSGDDLLFIEPTEAFTKEFSAFYESDTLYFESGMSGGPIFGQDVEGNLYVCAVIVSGSKSPYSGGIRVFNLRIGDFIRTYLR